MPLWNVQIIATLVHVCRVNERVPVNVPPNLEQKEGCSNENVQLDLLKLRITCPAPQAQGNASAQQIEQVKDEIDAKPTRKFSDAVNYPGIPEDRDDEYDVDGEDQVDTAPQDERPNLTPPHILRK